MTSVSKFQAILKGKCPRCRQGNVFKYPIIYKPLGFDKMYERCPNCSFQYEIEPGFFIASMYISYAISVGIMLVTGSVLFFIAGDPPTWIYLVSVSSILVLSAPLMFRYARVLLLHFFSGVKYQRK